MAKKRMSRKELHKTDPMTERLENIANQIMEKRKVIIFGTAAVVVLLAGVGVVRVMQQSSRKARARAVSAAFAPLSAPIQATRDPETDEPIEAKKVPFLTFTSDTDRLAAAKEGLAALQAQYGSERVALVAQIVQASRRAGGDPATAKAALSSLGSEVAELKPLTTLALGRIAWEAGDMAAAAKAYESIIDPSPVQAGLTALARIGAGDVANPQFGGEGEIEAARTQYRAVLALADAPGKKVTSLDRQRSAAAIRLALLPGGASEKIDPPKEPAEAPVPAKSEGADGAKN